MSEVGKEVDPTEHPLVKFVEYIATHETFNFDDAVESLPSQGLKVEEQKELVAIADHEDSKYTFRATASALFKHIEIQELREAREASVNAQDAAAKAYWLAIATLIISTMFTVAALVVSIMSIPAK